MDYVSGPYSIMISAGDTTASFYIAINDDDILEDDEKFDLSINRLSPSSQVNADPDNATVTIVDNEGRSNVKIK